MVVVAVVRKSTWKYNIRGHLCTLFTRLRFCSGYRIFFPLLWSPRNGLSVFVCERENVCVCVCFHRKLNQNFCLPEILLYTSYVARFPVLFFCFFAFYCCCCSRLLVSNFIIIISLIFSAYTGNIFSFFAVLSCCYDFSWRLKERKIRGKHVRHFTFSTLIFFLSIFFFCACVSWFWPDSLIVEWVTMCVCVLQCLDLVCVILFLW